MKAALGALSVTMLLATATFAHEEHKKQPVQMPDMSMQHCNEIMLKKLGAGDSQYDARFIDMMIAHHEGALAMSKDALGKARHAELKAKAQEVIDAQQKEITQMKAWRDAWYGGSQKGK